MWVVVKNEHACHRNGLAAQFGEHAASCRDVRFNGLQGLSGGAARWLQGFLAGEGSPCQLKDDLGAFGPAPGDVKVFNSAGELLGGHYIAQLRSGISRDQGTAASASQAHEVHAQG
jgi:hypothetical protein